MPTPTLLFKSAVLDAADESQILDVREDEGIVTAIVSVTGVIDEVDDIIEPGAYADTLKKRMPKVCWHHSWEHPIGRVLSIEELMPGDKRLPTKTRDGKAWPAEAGALVATMQMNMKSDRGREAFEAIKFYSESGECEYSIGYAVEPGKSTTKDGVRRIKSIDLYELSFVLFGAHTMTGTLALKAAVMVMHEKKDAGLAEVTIDDVRRVLADLGVTFEADGTMIVPASAADGPSTDPAADPTADDTDPDPVVANGVGEELVDAEDALGDETAPEDLGPAAKALLGAQVKALGLPASAVQVKLTPQGEFKDTNPGDLSQGARELINWYERGEGADLIGWGTHGDFARCEAIAVKHMTPEQAAGFCSNRHLGATGVRPGQEKAEVEVVDEKSIEAKVNIPDTTAKDPEPDDEDPKVTGVMVALYPSPDAASQIAVRGGEKPEDLHITLAYMGNVSDSGTNGLDLAASASQIIAACQIAAATHEPLSGSVGGIGKFPDSGSGVPIIALVDVPGLTALRESVFEALTDAQLPVKTDHGFTPHMTLGYNLDLALIPMTEEVPVTFDQLVVSVGEQRQMVPLGVDAGADPSLAPPAGVEMPPVAVDATAVALKAMAYDPAIEKGSEAGHRPPVATERKAYPFLTGTLQERMDSIRCALEDYFLGSLDEEERDKHYVSMDGTWDDRVVCTVNNWREVGDDKCRTYELSYTVNDDGSIILGDPEEVRLAVRVIEAPDGTPEDTADEIPPGDLMYLPEMVDDVVRAIKVCSGAGERKAGRVLSANNATRLKQVVETLITVLEAAGIDINPSPTPTSPTVDTETTAPSAHDGKSVTIDSADLAGVLAGLTAD